MTDAPERIWAWYVRSQDGQWLGQHCATDRKPNASGATEYVRADLSDRAAGYAAGIEASFAKVESLTHEWGENGCSYIDRDEALTEIRALSPSAPAPTPSTPARDGVD